MLEKSLGVDPVIPHRSVRRREKKFPSNDRFGVCGRSFDRATDISVASAAIPQMKRE